MCTLRNAGARGVVRWVGLALYPALIIGIAPGLLLIWLPSWLSQRAGAHAGAPQPALLLPTAVLGLTTAAAGALRYTLPSELVGAHTVLVCVVYFAGLLLLPLVRVAAVGLEGTGATKPAPAPAGGAAAAHAAAAAVYVFVGGMLFATHAASIVNFVAAGAPWGDLAALAENASGTAFQAAHFLFVDNLTLAATTAGLIAATAGGWLAVAAFLAGSVVVGFGAALALWAAVREARLALAAARSGASKTA
jgi:hypothetical protein